ncbi:hypothetical protein BU25DRAFT_73865 [Macroventuria anomochaeta]|uniref:Uncharacterized protein n=1 Tax=Macroventuria anomochaeta TaxID=301207 RepID=A0ACB6RXU8_9PLEO|nr:uncharacterized protein BU25DRAFT_73865 [Macroventuria anomochaeta]KAF2626855.1 hypothetical protein BU25DRAFT_73865 [Macroventuria anomochaeta]
MWLCDLDRSSIAAQSLPRSHQNRSHYQPSQSSTYKSIPTLPQVGLWARRRVILNPAGGHSLRKPFSKWYSRALTITHSATVAHRHLIWHGGSLTAASSRVGTCISKYRAPVTVEAKVREGDELRHHDAVVKDMMEAGARTEKQVLWPADHTVDSGW